MTKEEFMELFEKSENRYKIFLDKKGNFLRISENYDFEIKENIRDLDKKGIEYKIVDAVGVIITFGGKTGGNCYNAGEENAYTEYSTGDKFEHIEDLENICDILDISYRDYKKVKEKIRSENKSTSDYYGNCENRKLYYVILDEIYDILSDYNLDENFTAKIWNI